MADRFPQFDWKQDDALDLFLDHDAAASLVDQEFFAAPSTPASTIYLGTRGEGVVWLAARTPAQVALGARPIF